MLFFLPIVILIGTALIILIIHFLKPGYKYFWLIALAGSFLAWLGVFLWKINSPLYVSFPPWPALSIFSYTPSWLADSTSWPYALALTTLGIAVVLTDVARKEIDPLPWSGLFLLTATGILAVAAGDPLTLILVWSAMDLSELGVMIRSAGTNNQVKKVIIAYSLRVIGMGMVIGGSVLDASELHQMSFGEVSDTAAICYLAGILFRLGILPLNLNITKNGHESQGTDSSIQLVAAASSLAFLARIPLFSLSSSWTLIILLLVAVPTFFSSWMWWRAFEGLPGRQFWIMGMAFLAIGSAILGNPEGSIGWGIVMVLTGALLFLSLPRPRNIIWLVFLGSWSISSLPFSPTSSYWTGIDSFMSMSLLLFIPSQILLLSGYIRHAGSKENNFQASKEGWTQILYVLGLSILAGVVILLSLWGWDGSFKLGDWWISLLVVLPSIGLVFYTKKNGKLLSRKITRQGSVIHIGWFTRIASFLYRFLENITRIITNTLEGDGGVFWSFLLLVLILSLLSSGK